MYKSCLPAAAVAAALLFSPVPARAQSQCEALLDQRITASGPILRIIELEDFVHAVSFRDGRTGCQLVLLEGLLRPNCAEGGTITVSGVVIRDPRTKRFEIDNPSSGAAVCR